MHLISPVTRRGFIGTACAVVARAAAPPVIDIHQHTNYHRRSDADLIGHQRSMGIARTVLLPAGSSFGLAAGAGGNDTVLALATAHPREFDFFANELPSPTFGGR